ncbi:hypothetical protein [Pseudalkalibacillus berkeleyi]|uniref:Uncharacterized protein n=1 Tax=Pseudalkalibacillus berkeleyi TaxID=1069813 RepID=A0ABS9H0G7_9BACL|nr:hypothetical protein [Pseudalkalibacillus berkeleyi]MCF6137243.1 hypothetical protein [Pseudalkalibacillus berkeleyi]
MGYDVNGFTDMYTLLSNERKIGGAIEASRIRLSTGEEFTYPVITNVDYSGSTFYSLGFITDNGEKYIVNIKDISMMAACRHCPIQELRNDHYKKVKTDQRINYLKRLCEINEGASTPIFEEEVHAIINDIGEDVIKNDKELSHLQKQTNQNRFRIA